MNQRPLLPQSQLSPAALDAITHFHPDIVAHVAEAITQHDVVIVGMAQNPVVKKARKVLTEAGIPFHLISYGSYFSAWKERLAIKMWSGWPTFPQVFVKGTLIGGCAETVAALADGTFKARLGS